MSRILILRTDHLGDVILTTPLIRALAKAGHEVDFVLPGAFLPVLAGNPHLREAIALETIAPDWRRQWLRLAGWIWSRGYDVTIVPFGGNWQLLAASLLSGVRRRIAMFAGIAGRLTLHQCLRSGLMSHPRYMPDVLLDCARALGVPDDGLLPEVAFEEPLEAAAAADGTPVIGIHPGCAGNTCNFSPAAYGEIVRLILDRTDWRIVLTGTAAERALTDGWEPRLLASDRLRDTRGTLSLRELAALQKSLALFLSTGTGPLHLAVALGVPTLTPFCPRPRIGRAVWGNPRPNGLAVEAPCSACTAMPDGNNCDFNGKISPLQMFEAAQAWIGRGIGH